MRVPFTVLMAYPDYATDNYGEDTYLAHVEAKGPEEAVKVAQCIAYATYMDDTEIADMTGDFRDFKVLAMFGGHLIDLAAGCNELPESSMAVAQAGIDGGWR